MISPNQEKGRRGEKIQGFVIHITDGSYESAISWIMDPKSQVSYHFVISKTGSMTCLVLPDNTAWHAGLIKNPTAEIIKPGSNPNLYTIGIALAGLSTEKPSIEQITSVSKIIKMLATYYNIPLDKKTIITHNSIRSDKFCPGQFVSIEAILYLSNLTN